MLACPLTTNPGENAGAVSRLLAAGCDVLITRPTSSPAEAMSEKISSNMSSMSFLPSARRLDQNGLES